MSGKKNSRLAAPILFSSEDITLTSGRSALADTGALSTKFRRPFWIDDIRFTVTALYSGSASDSFATQVRLRLGPYHLSDRFIPFQNYAPILNSFCENQAFGDGGSGRYAWYRWKLPKPLFVPEGMTLVPEFFRDLGKTPTTVTVGVTFAGRYQPPRAPEPKEVDVPWVTMFTPPTSAVFAQSSELDLYNPFQRDLEVQRFLFANQDDTGSGYTVVNQDLVTVMKDSAGTNVIRDFTPTGSVFDLNRRAWTFNKVLAPRERYNITLQALTGTLNNYNISLVGSRKERL